MFARQRITCGCHLQEHKDLAKGWNRFVAEQLSPSMEWNDFLLYQTADESVRVSAKEKAFMQEQRLDRKQETDHLLMAAVKDPASQCGAVLSRDRGVTNKCAAEKVLCFTPDQLWAWMCGPFGSQPLQRFLSPS